MVEFVQFPQRNQDNHVLASGEEQPRETARQSDRETERQRDSETDRRRGRDTERQRDTEPTAYRTATAELMPTLRALDETGAKIECFLPPRVHIDGW